MPKHLYPGGAVNAAPRGLDILMVLYSSDTLFLVAAFWGRSKNYFAPKNWPCRACIQSARRLAYKFACEKCTVLAAEFCLTTQRLLGCVCVGGGGANTPPPSDPDFVAGKDEILHKKTLIWLFFAHKRLDFWVPAPSPPPSP